MTNSNINHVEVTLQNEISQFILIDQQKYFSTNNIMIGCFVSKH